MTNIYTDTYKEDILKAISSVEGLSDAVEVLPLADVDDTSHHLLIDADLIKVPIPWEGTEPPILLQEITYTEGDLLALVLARLGYDGEALQFVSSTALQAYISYRLRLQGNGFDIENLSQNTDDYYAHHNKTLLAYYTDESKSADVVQDLFEAAISKAPTEEHAAFTAKHLATLLMDRGENHAAGALIKKYQELALSEKGKRFLELDLINVQMNLELGSYSVSDLKELKSAIWDALNYFDKTHYRWVVADLYIKASEITNVEKSYTESLNYISKAISIYEEENLPEFLASAYLRKGTLLYTWAQDENPQFYQSAIDTYQEALKVFTREHFPHIFAEIHHNLAVIYAEMPVEEKKRGMWSAFSATSFKECLDFYQKDTYPFEYAMVANNYGNALLKYPPAKTGDNSEKAIHYYLEALEIRDARQFPVERAHTILNYLEACWQVHNINKTMERARYRDMLSKAKEIEELTEDKELIQQARNHLSELSALSVAIMNG